MKKGDSLIVRFARLLLIPFRNIFFRGSQKYWQSRYGKGGTSGAGSYGQLAKFKADVLNDFVKEHRVRSVIDFGCGDGNQLILANYPSYIGLDISRTAIKLCKDRFKGDETKSFFLFDIDCFIDTRQIFSADLAISLDVIYHLVEDRSFDLYMRKLFAASKKFVIIYSCDTDKCPLLQPPHVKYRKFTAWVSKHLPEWKLLRTIPNQHAFAQDPENESISDFYIYEKVPS